MRVRLTEDALSDLGAIKAFFVNRSIVGERILDHIGKVIEGLRVFPRLGHPGVVGGTLERSVPRSRYVIVYRFDAGGESDLVILRVYHTAQDRSHGEY